MKGNLFRIGPRRRKSSVIWTCLFSVFLLSALEAQEPLQSFLIDFGPDDGVNGNATESPDRLARAWNNVPTSAQGSSIDLTNDLGEESAYSLTLVSTFSTNGINHGGLLAPDEALLGELAIATVTQDYFFTTGSSSFSISGLDPTRSYRLLFFATRENTQTRITNYTVESAQSQSYSLQTSGLDIGSGGYDGNNDTVLASDVLTARADGSLTITVSREAGDFAYIGALILEEYEAADIVLVDSIVISGEDIGENGGASQMSAAVFPDSAQFQGVSWSVRERSMANIREDGLLIPMVNGEITVQAMSQEPDSEVSDTKTISVAAQVVSHFLVDLGPDDGVDGNATMSPDVYGNTWNNITSPFSSGPSIDVRDIAGASTDISLQVIKSMTDNGIEDGGLLEVSDSLLGDFAVATATQDYFRTGNTGQIQISGLSTSSGYRIHCFSSRSSESLVRTAVTAFGANGVSGSMTTGGEGIGADDYDGNNNSFYTTDLVFPDVEGRIILEFGQELGSFGYLNAFRVTEYTSLELCEESSENLIAVVGSSVARGQGAPDDMGYAFQYKQLLEERAAEGLGAEWDLFNLSVGGDNTVKVLDRWARDVPGLCPEYVVLGLSLGNEGIVNGGQMVFDQFRDNMLELVALAESQNITPVVVNCYPRQDFDALDYQYIKDMNLLIHSWNLASINVLGAIDNGTGNWATGYQEDFGHPNLAGHLEYSYAFPPSLFDAISDGKKQPEWAETETKYALGTDLNRFLTTHFDETAHAFTHSFEFQSNMPGEISTIDLGDDSRSSISLNILDDGKLEYRDSEDVTLRDTSIITDGQWHRVTLSHYYAQARSYLYLDGRLIGTAIEAIEPELVNLGGYNAPGEFSVRNWLLYRSGMNGDEIQAIQDGNLLKSSLEVYAPLDEDGVLGDHPLFNRAQSRTRVSEDRIGSRETITSKRYMIQPNPAMNQLQISSDVEPISQDLEARLFDIHGRLVLAAYGHHKLDLSSLSPGVYTLQLSTPDGHIELGRIVKQ